MHLFFWEKGCLLIQLSLKYAFKIQSNNDQALLQISAWCKAIIWINDGLVYWCIYASLSFNELNYVIQCAAILSQVGLMPDPPRLTHGAWEIQMKF